MNGKVIAFGLFWAMPSFGSSCCNAKLDALQQTLLRLRAGATQVTTDLENFQASCCTLSRVPGSACSCTTTPITAAGVLPANGSYCLANDVTGNIDATGLQVRIHMNGHKVTGNVILGQNSFIENGSITGNLTLDSFSRAESLRIGVDGVSSSTLFGVASENVSLSDIIFESDLLVPIQVDGFGSIVIDTVVFKSGLNFTNTNNVVMRRSQVFGGINHLDSTLATMYLYDVSAHGEEGVASSQIFNPTSFSVWNSSFDVLEMDFNTDAVSTSPVLNFYGSTFESLAFAASLPVFNPTCLVDECVSKALALVGMQNTRCQHCMISGVGVLIEGGQQITFDHVQAYSSVGDAFTISPGFNVLLKQCTGVANSGSSAAFNINDFLNINLFECVAKDSAVGFSFDGSNLTGSVLRCVAENCGQGFVDNSNVKMVFADNVSVSNPTNNYAPAGTFNPSTNPLTAVSWRNIANV